MTIDVFVSVGRTGTDQQAKFVVAVERLLMDSGLVPRRAEFSSVRPLKKIDEVMAGCCGAVIIALERVVADHAVELPGGPSQRNLEQLRLPSVWNQVEAAFSYSRGLPLLVMCQEGLRAEGLLEAGYDWYVQSVQVDPALTDTREFRGIFDDWRTRVEAFHANASAPKPRADLADVANLTVVQIIGALKPAQLWAALSALVALGAAIATIAYKVGHG